MRGSVSTDMSVQASAKDIWAVFSSNDLPKMLPDLLPGAFEKIDIIQGDGGVGTKLHVVLAQGIPEPRSWNEKFMMIDDVRRMKRIQVTKGGLLDFGFRSYENVFQIIEKGTNSCIIRSTVHFEADEDKFEANASQIKADASWGVGKAIANHVVQKKTTV
ncbi:hypothetical protein GIB67_037239 [Kingdonia uniflora]|uniref:Bet v I/Major latex protein domain-containing protein n=1 Tax=Kingdonia uniflora TaxID=39325 RepID=A0A7J7MS10_9MAGN|nr:hypothetical protein GIB67_037239 [Kingdonia uniflora]